LLLLAGPAVPAATSVPEANDADLYKISDCL